MTRFTRLRHEAHVRANDVCIEHRDTFDVSTGAKKTRLQLDGYVTESTRLLAVQKRALEERTAATEQCRRCRAALRAVGKTVVRVGRLVTLPDTVMDTLRIPGSMSDTALQAHMQGLHDRVLPYRDAFEAVGLPAEALTMLTDGIKALEAARAAYATTIQDAASAREALREIQNRTSPTILALEAIAATTPAATANREVVIKLKVARRVGPKKASLQAGA